MAIRIAINGFGRIGRQITRLLFSGFGKGVELRAINSLEPLECAAHLLRFDSNHGGFSLPVTSRGQELIIAEQAISFYNQSDPGCLPWRELGIDLVIEASGQLRDRHQADQHLRAGARKVVITAAAHNPDLTLCFGVNQDSYRPEIHHIISGSSCTTNCLAPALKVLNDRIAISTCLATFLHSYTSNQNLLDLQQGNDLRRMRAAGKNIIPTTTSATQQLPEVIPELIGRFHAVAIRVPTPEVHLAYCTMSLSRHTTAQELLDLFSEAAQGSLNGILAITHAPLVSIDFKGAKHSSVIDSDTIKVINGDMVQLMIWHDNESSYCKRIIDLVRYVTSN